MRDSDRIRLFSNYQAPRLRRGDRAWCLYRDCLVVVTGGSDARIPWPLCVTLHRRGSPSGLLVDEELARAVRHESCAAVVHWWGINQTTVINWRRSLGVTRTNNEGTHRLVLGAIEATLDSRFGK